MSSLGLAALLRLIGPATAADLPATLPVKAPPMSTAYDWTGFYVGGYLGYAWGNSNWTTAPGISGSLNLTQRLERAVSSPDFNSATTTCCRTASSSGR
jgi:opacity protein-like surface antigen